MQTLTVTGILCRDGRSPTEIWLAIQESISEGKLVSLNLAAAPDALQKLRDIIFLPSVPERCVAASAAASSDEHTMPLECLQAQLQRHLDAEPESPPPSPRDSVTLFTDAPEAFCPPATLSSSDAAPMRTHIGDADLFAASLIALSNASLAALQTASAADSQRHLQAVHPAIPNEPWVFGQSLVALNLSDCILDAPSLRCACTLLSMMNLQTIILERCGIDDSGAAALACTVSFYSSLRTLNLRHNAITDCGAKQLLLAAQSHVHLQTIVCDGCRVSCRLQRILWDISKKKCVAEAPQTPPQVLRESPSKCKPAHRSPFSKRTHTPRDAPAASPSIELLPSRFQQLSPDDGGTLQQLVSSFVSFTLKPRPWIPSSTSVPVSPLVFNATPHRFSTPVGTRRRDVESFDPHASGSPNMQNRLTRLSMK